MSRQCLGGVSKLLSVSQCVLFCRWHSQCVLGDVFYHGCLTVRFIVVSCIVWRELSRCASELCCFRS